MRRCSRCVLPETVPGITFNEQGVCSYCQSFTPHHVLGEKALDEIVNSIRGKGKDYDCIVPFSGGRDSTYVLYVASRKYGLRVLAVNYDNEFRVPQAVENMKVGCDKVGAKLLCVRSKKDRGRAVVRTRLRATLSNGLPKIVGAPCIACAYGCRGAVFQIAESYKVPLIMWGESPNEATSNLEAKALALVPSGSTLSQVLSLNYVSSELAMLGHRWEFCPSGVSVFSKQIPALRSDFTREIRLFDYLRWDRKQLKDTITNELGWKKPESSTSTWRTDCWLHVFKTYCYYHMFGCSKECFGYSQMINDGQMTREEALEQEENLHFTQVEEFRKLLEDEIGLSKSEIEQLGSYATRK